MSFCFYLFHLYIYLNCPSSLPTGLPLGVELAWAGTVDRLDDDVDELVSALLVDSDLIFSFAVTVPLLAFSASPGLELRSSWRLLMNLL